MPNLVLTRALSALCVLSLAACGGGGGGTSAENMELEDVVTPVPVLSDDTVTTQIDVTVLSRSGTDAGTFNAVDGLVTVGTTATGAPGTGMDADLDYIRFTDVGSVAVSETIDTITLGSATYRGSAALRVTDTIAATVYEGEVTARIRVDFGDAGGTTIDYTGFSGTRQIGLGTATDFTDGSVSISDATASRNGTLSGGAIDVSGFGGVNFDDATTDVDGRFGGPEAEEVGGIVTATATDGTLTSAFVGAR